MLSRNPFLKTCIDYFRSIVFGYNSVFPTAFDIIDCTSILQDDVDYEQPFRVFKPIGSTTASYIDRDVIPLPFFLTLGQKKIALEPSILGMHFADIIT